MKNDKLEDDEVLVKEPPKVEEVYVPPECLMARPEEAANIEAVISSVNAEEKNRRRWRFLMDVAPWFVSVICVAFAGNAGYIIAHRPIPKPEMYISIYRSDGSVEAPVERGNLSADRKAFIVKSDLQHFIEGWENYAWGANRSYYDRISAMTAGEKLQASYQESWRDPHNPENRDVKYGPNVTRYVSQLQTSPLEGAPYALTGRALIRLTRPEGSTCEWWQVDLTFKQDHNSIPVSAQLAYDPSDTIVRTYTSRPADGNHKPWNC